MVACRQNERHFFGGLSSGKRFLPKGRLRTAFFGPQRLWHRALQCPKNAPSVRSAGLSLNDLCVCVLCVFLGGCGVFLVWWVVVCVVGVWWVILGPIIRYRELIA